MNGAAVIILIQNVAVYTPSIWTELWLMITLLDTIVLKPLSQELKQVDRSLMTLVKRLRIGRLDRARAPLLR